MCSLCGLQKYQDIILCQSVCLPQTAFQISWWVWGACEVLTAVLLAKFRLGLSTLWCFSATPRCGVAYHSVDSSWIVWFDTCISWSWTLDLNNARLVNVEVTAVRNAKCVDFADLVAWEKPDTQHSRTLKVLAFSVEHCQIWNGVSWRKSLMKLFWCGL